MIKNYKIAVTGVGGGVGQSIIKALYQTGYGIVGMDADCLATGLYGVPNSYKIPKASDPIFIDDLLKLCQQNECKVLFPGLDTELLVLSQNREKFKKIGTTVIVSSPDVIQVSDNKLLTFELLSSNKIAVPVTYKLSDFLKNKALVKFPVVIKPMIGGSRSIGVEISEDGESLDWLISKKGFQSDRYVVQEKLEGDEYTCGTINLNNDCKGVIVMRRILRDGDTYKCFTVKDQKIEDTVYKVMSVLKPFGACNVQLRVHNGTPTVFEVNARCSGTTGARAMAGFNEPKMIADYLLYGTPPKYNIRIVSILRYWKELVVENDDIKQIEMTGKLIQKLYKRL